MIPRLKEIYYREIQPSLKTKFGFKNLYMVPKIQKVVLNMGLGLDGNDSKILKSCEEDLAKITGQKPIITKEAFIHLSNLKNEGEKKTDDKKKVKK